MQERSNSSDRSRDAEATCPRDSSVQLPTAGDISITTKQLLTGDQGPSVVQVFWLSLSVLSLVSLLLSSATKVTITARHQLLNLAHTWAGPVWSPQRVTSSPLVPWRHSDLLPPPWDMLSLVGYLTQGTMQLALRWRVKLNHGVYSHMWKDLGGSQRGCQPPEPEIRVVKLAEVAALSSVSLGMPQYA
ncbi:hypothetical protein HispidOSU_023113 [Sigmodon hispidus]